MKPRAVLFLILFLGLSLGPPDLGGEESRLPRSQYKSGDQTLEALSDLSKAVRNSIVKLDVDGKTVALGTVVDSKGLIATKASELGKGRLTAWLATGKEVSAELLGKDLEDDVALVRIDARGLKPVEWAPSKAVVGQWVVTAGIASVPQALGIVSVPARRIRHARAIIGIHLARNGTSTQIESLMEGLGAQKAGLKPGDQILAVNDLPVKRGEELVKKLREFREGQTVNLKVQRGPEEFEAQVAMMRPGGDLEERDDRIDRMGGDPSARAEGFELAIQHDTVLQPWQCGGPLLNLDGKAVGLNIARAGRVASYALPSEVARRVIDQLKARFVLKRRG